MEFHEKLQHLRKQFGMTQEQLAEKLFVSRTAISKWESGRGYPNLESLKCISKLFSVSIDELLSNNELMELAETENRANIGRMAGLVFGVLDAITIVFLFMPLFGRQNGEYVEAVMLSAYTGVAEWLRILYFAVIALISLFGVFEMIAQQKNYERGLRIGKPCSIGLCAAAILLFAFSRQAYITVLLFLLFMVKVVLLLQESRIR